MKAGDLTVRNIKIKKAKRSITTKFSLIMHKAAQINILILIDYRSRQFNIGDEPIDVLLSVDQFSILYQSLWIELSWPENLANTCSRYMEILDIGLSGYGNSIHTIIPLLKKENVHLYPCPWGYNNYADAYFQSSWEDVVQEATVFSVKSTDVTCKTRSG